MPNFTLKDYLSEVEGEFDKNLSKYVKTISIGQYDDNGVNIGFLYSNEVIKNFISQSITKAVTESLREVVAGVESNSQEEYCGCLDKIDTNAKKILGE